MSLIALTFIGMSYIEAVYGQCNPYTYEACNSYEMSAISKTQFERRNNIDQHISKGEKFERIVTGRPTQRWLNKPYVSRYMGRYITRAVIQTTTSVESINGVWTNIVTRKEL